MTAVAAGKRAPEVKLDSTNGQPISLAETLKKGPTVLAFYKVSCPVCQFTFPFLERIHQAYGGDKVTVLGVSQDDARDSKDFMKEFGVTFPSLLDVECRWPASNAYGLTNVPTVFLIEPDGTVKVSSVGFSKKDLQQISAELARTSGKRPVDVFRAGETVPDFKPG